MAREKGEKMIYNYVKSLNAWLKPFNEVKDLEESTFILNKKANAKLDYVVKAFESTLGRHFEVEEDRSLRKEIKLKDLYFLDHMTMYYTLQNRLLARTYDLIFHFTIPCDKRSKYLELELGYEGKRTIKGARFVKVKGAESKVVLEKLNNHLLMDRLKTLDFLEFKIKYRPKKKEWDVMATSIIGSAVWTFMPPVFRVIKPTQEECIRMIEAFELIAHGITQ